MKKAGFYTAGLVIILIISGTVKAGPKFHFGEDKDLEIFLMGQIWTVYGFNIDIPGQSNLKNTRGDIYIRRGRFGFKGDLMKNLSWKIWFAYDNFGKNDLNPVDIVKGTVNTGGLTYSRFEVWDAYFTWAVDEQFGNISLGYFRPQIGKESITSGFAVLSFEKGLPNFYVRRHIIGKPDTGSTGFSSANGRIFLINWGGLYKSSGWSLNWNFGVGDNQNYTTSSNWSPLLSARLALSIGDPEMKKYKLGYTQTYFGKRNGVTLGLNYGHQGKGVDRKFIPDGYPDGKPFDKNEMYGIDILANYGQVDLFGEYDILKRRWADGTDYSDKVWTVKAAYNFKFLDGQILQPAIAYGVFDPDNNGNSIYGRKKNVMLDIGVNWYIQEQKIKLTLHYASGKVYDYAGEGDAKSSYVGFGFQFGI
ncbi:porin [Persephonella sp.]